VRFFVVDIEPIATGDSVKARKGSFSTVAAKGSFINTLQWFINKVATAVAMLAIAHYLTPDDFGIGAQALAVAQFLVILIPLTMGDILIAHPRRLELLAPTARTLATTIGFVICLLTLGCIPIILFFYTKYPAAWLGGLIAAASIRPLLDSQLMVPLARLRTELGFKKIALIDGVVQLVVTAFSVVGAALGMRGATIVVPQLVGTLARVVWYRKVAPQTTMVPTDRRIAFMLMKSFLPASSAQYLHNVIVMLEILVLGLVSGDVQTGLFGFAFMIAAQANTIIAYQLGVVLQPIFGKLQDEPARQVSGFIRVQRVLALVCVPVSLAQVVLAEPLFRIAFAEKWQPAVPVFQMISLAQAFYFATGPSMSCLRSQRRFATFFRWQGIQLVLSAPLYWLGSAWMGALGVATTSGVTWAISSPIVVYLCTRTVKSVKLTSVISIFAKPWLIGVAIFAPGLLAIRWLASFGVAGDVISLAIIGPVLVVAALFAARQTDSEMRQLSDRAIGALRGRMRRGKM